MSLIRRRPRRRTQPLSRLASELPLEGWVGVPIDLVETDDEIIVSAEIPGLKPEDIDVSMVGNRLMLKGAFEAEEERERGDVYVCERRYGSFQRRIDLPTSVDVDAAEATFKNGVLKVELPKSKPTERKQIEVKRPFEEI